MKRHSTVCMLALLLLAGTVMSACGNTAAQTESSQASTASVTEADVETEPAEPDPFKEFDYNGEQIRIYTSINVASGVGNSNYLIEGPEEETGDVVSDSALFRNRSVEEILNVDLVFTQVDLDYTACGDRTSVV